MTGTAVNNSLRIGTASMGVFIGEISTLLWDMRWLMLLAGVLIVVDLWLGVHNSIANNVDIRASRALRRTMMKIADYLCVVILGAVVGKALGEPLGCSAIVIAVVLMSIACLCKLFADYFSKKCGDSECQRARSIVWLINHFFQSRFTCLLFLPSAR